jgi:hypothetical protein
MPFVLAVIAALGGVAFWRRKKIGDDASRISEAARSRVQEYRSDKKKLLTELGQHYYSNSTNGDDADHEAEMARIVGQLIELDGKSALEDVGESSAEEEGDITDEVAKSE